MDDAPIERLTVADLVRRADFTLGSAAVSPATRVIRGPGGEATLEPRAMQVLLALADAGGVVVTRDELFRRCWGNAVVGDDSLNRAVADVRRVARTVAADSFQIETVPRTGYRLVERNDAAAAPRGSVSAVTSTRSRRAMVFGAAAAATVLGATYWASTRARRDPPVADLVSQSDEAMRLDTPESVAHAVELLETAVALHPRDATAWGRLALAQTLMLDSTPPGQAAATVSAVQAASRRALALEPRQADALSAQAILPPYFGDWLAAERRLRAVLATAPSHLPTQDELAFMLVGVGRARESAEARLKFAPREPLHAGHQYRLIYAYWILGRIEEADRAADRALGLWPKHYAVWFARLWVLAFTGRPDRALIHLQDVVGRPEFPPWMIEALTASLTAIYSGRRADRAKATDLLLAQMTRSPSLSINALLLLAGMGEVDRAFEVANAYLLEDGPLMASVRWRAGEVTVNDQRHRKTHMLFVPATAAMRADPRFDDLARRIGLADYWAKAGVGPDVMPA